jgi:hypothetical protein
VPCRVPHAVLQVTLGINGGKVGARCRRLHAGECVEWVVLLDHACRVGRIKGVYHTLSELLWVPVCSEGLR